MATSRSTLWPGGRCTRLCGHGHRGTACGRRFLRSWCSAWRVSSPIGNINLICGRHDRFWDHVRLWCSRRNSVMGRLTASHLRRISQTSLVPVLYVDTMRPLVKSICLGTSRGLVTELSLWCQRRRFRDLRSWRVDGQLSMRPYLWRSPHIRCSAHILDGLCRVKCKATECWYLWSLWRRR